MAAHPSQELPIRSKFKMIHEVAFILKYLQEGDRKRADPLLEDLKVRSLFFEEGVQRAVVAFVAQVLFEYNCNPIPQVNEEIGKAADLLLESLGFVV